MKSKHCFILLVVIMCLFSLTAMAAGENSTSFDDIALDNDISDSAGDGIDEVGEIPSDDNDGQGIDLSIRAETKNFDGHIAYDIPYTLTASVNGGIAHNTKVRLGYWLDEYYFAYDSCNVTMGTYNQDTKMWDIGDLSNSNDAYLTILIKFDPHGLHFGGGYPFVANATTDSMDTNMSNNFLIIYSEMVIKVTPVSETENINEPQHEEFIISNPSDEEVVVKIDGQEDNSDSSPPQDNSQKDETDNADDGVNHNSDSNNGEISDSDGNLNSNTVSKEIGQQNILEKSINSLADSILDIFNPDSDFSNGNVNDSLNVAAIYAYDYTRIPVMIFALFLIMLIGAYGYDKIKS